MPERNDITIYPGDWRETAAIAERIWALIDGVETKRASPITFGAPEKHITGI